LKHIQRLATIGVDNAAVLSLADGVATGKCGAFVIDSELLPKLQFIREGEFQETTGAPTVRIIGDAEILGIGQVTPVQTQVRPTVILPTDIIEKFLMQNYQTGPLEYIKAICFEQSPYMPIYYYARQVEMSHNDLVKFVENSNGIGRRLLLKRLNEDDAHARYYKLPKGEISASKRLGVV
ncbi:hypothetical protein, partial [Methanothrix soehngenii]|uniref:hypothetical protein n=1 Tax=Methanothrix soehngenii TaxID=2223 RepID=UPI00300DB962